MIHNNSHQRNFVTIKIKYKKHLTAKINILMHREYGTCKSKLLLNQQSSEEIKKKMFSSAPITSLRPFLVFISYFLFNMHYFYLVMFVNKMGYVGYASIYIICTYTDAETAGFFFAFQSDYQLSRYIIYAGICSQDIFFSQ